ncbi:MAG: hypothetical protein V4596_00090 [Bdellovibrionota bacterium]
MLSLILPQWSYAADSCATLFEAKPKVNFEAQLKSLVFVDEFKALILRDALRQNPHIQLKGDKSYINEVLNRWNLKDSSPAQIEKIAQALVIKLDEKRTFFQWVREIILKGDYVREAMRVRSETRNLTIDILDAMDVRGYFTNKDSLAFRKNHYNKIQLGKFVAVNGALMSAIYYLTGTFVPALIYVPKLDILRNIDLDQADLTLIRVVGFYKAYPKILQKYKLQLRSQIALEQAPKVLFLSVASYIGYNYLSFRVEKKIEEVRYSVPAEQKASIYKDYFELWKADYEKRESRPLDMKNAQDRTAWETFVKAHYRAWADTYQATNGHYPDLTKEQDLREWEQFLALPE